jgi:hypothetical protein
MKIAWALFRLWVVVSALCVGFWVWLSYDPQERLYGMQKTLHLIFGAPFALLILVAVIGWRARRGNRG